MVHAFVSPFTGASGSPSVASNRISFLMNPKGSDTSIDTTYSVSVIVVNTDFHNCQNYICSNALVAASNLFLRPDTYIALASARMLTVSGRCRTFDASADGFARGEGCGAFLYSRETEDTKTLVSL
jgi:acyl transferase domain-containing protein